MSGRGCLYMLGWEHQYQDNRRNWRIGIKTHGYVCAVVMNVEQDIAVYTVRALGDARVLNRQLHVRPPLNALSQHDMAHIWEDKVFRQLCIGSRLNRSIISAADLDKRIAGAPSAHPTA